MIPKMQNECFRAFISTVSVLDLQSPNLTKMAENFEQDFNLKAKQKQLLKTTVVLKRS